MTTLAVDSSMFEVWMAPTDICDRQELDRVQSRRPKANHGKARQVIPKILPRTGLGGPVEFLHWPPVILRIKAQLYRACNPVSDVPGRSDEGWGPRFCLATSRSGPEDEQGARRASLDTLNVPCRCCGALRTGLAELMAAMQVVTQRQASRRAPAHQILGLMPPTTAALPCLLSLVLTLQTWSLPLVV